MNTTARAPRPTRAIDYLLLFLCAFAVGLAFLKSPGLGDDFTYWKTAWAIHEEGAAGWNPESFHNLRWPIWGFCWVLQGIFGPGLASFYIVPFTYLALGAMIVYTFGSLLLSSRVAGWACAIAFFFHPLLDTVIFRPMPDMAEGVFIGLAVLCWLAIVEAESRKKRLFFALTAGVICAVAFANRFTGIFVFGVLGAVALVTLFNTSRIKWKEAILWLGVIGGTALALFCVEGLIYKQLTGDFLHNIHANMGAKGKKGTETVNVFLLPFRFIDALSGRGFIGPFYLILSAVGAVALAWKGGLRGRIIVAWAIILYLAYSCALQSFFPPRPLLRNADRFLCSLSIPFSILAVAGAGALLTLWKPAFAKVRRHGVLVALISIVLLGLATRRCYFSPGHIPIFRAYIEALPDGTTVFTHDGMRSAAFLVAPEKASTFKWITKHNILHQQDGLEAKSKEADEFWFCRKLTWLSDRQGIEREQIQSQDRVASYFIEPQQVWQLREVINVGGVPEFVLYRKRAEDARVPNLVEGKVYFPDLPEVPFSWKGKGGFEVKRTVPIPEKLRGKSVAIQFEGQSNFVQAFRGRLIFYRGKKRIEEVSIRPYFHRTDGIDFHHLAVPKEADSVQVILNISRKAEEITIKHIYILRE